MALPPEPLQELLAAADAVVIAEVLEVLEQGPTPPPPSDPRAGSPTFKGPIFLEARQRVRLRVLETLRGAAEGELVVDKPEAPYLLSAGVRGPFFLRQGAIIGRYGPDTHARAGIVAALG